MKRLMSVVLAVLMAASVFTACGGKGETTSGEGGQGASSPAATPEPTPEPMRPRF